MIQQIFFSLSETVSTESSNLSVAIKKRSIATPMPIKPNEMAYKMPDKIFPVRKRCTPSYPRKMVRRMMVLLLTLEYEDPDET